MLLHEQECFLRHGAIDPDRLRPFNVITAPPPLSLLDTTDVVMLGGSGDYSVDEEAGDLSWFPPMAELVLASLERGLPFFGTCMGIQVLARALGGSVVCDPTRQEIGTFEVNLTEAGRTDPLLSNLPSPFLANLGHKCRVERLPRGGVVLARSERCPVQALRLDRGLVYATQFHPELDYHGMRLRITTYYEKYKTGDGTGERDRLFAAIRPEGTPMPLIADFLALAARQLGN
ncbi:MAG: hypothetical protein A2284_17740 [Deltaproteobacteria bacterium RIFOXYA12_FULL_61_11]|nr:MAG: hypothetical protein A2284_17740 [Deltaproteobacteria bacterium RIFOXYA12_FULL_61_11]